MRLVWLVLALFGASPAFGHEVLHHVVAALQARAEGDLEEADRRLSEARELDPESAIAAREHAVVLAELGRFEGAREAIRRAITLGDVDPEVRELEARILAELGEPASALESAGRAGTWTADLIGASLGDRAAAHRASRWTEEASSRGAMAALILAAHAGSAGERTTARTLVDLSEHLARIVGAEPIAAAARELRERLGDGERIKLAARARSSVDYATNPMFQAVRLSGQRPYAVWAALAAEAGLQVPVSTARLDAAVRVDQRLQLLDRDRLEGLDLTALSLAASVEVPISNRPSAAEVGLTLRLHDVWGDAFTLHWATGFEAGATLMLPLDGATSVALGVFGVGIDFVDRSPPDVTISSQNRDRIGQRASIALLHDGGWFHFRGEAAFSRDDAFGEAFDSRGGILAARIWATVTEGVSLRTGIAVWLRSFGPVGDAVVLGDASTRLEVRTVAEVGAQIALNETLALVIDEAWIQNDGRQGHDYTHNVLSLGLEAAW